MPSFLAEAPSSAVTGLFPHDKRTSFDRQSQAADRIDGHENHHPEEKNNAPNGILPNGSASNAFARSNGQLAETKSHASRESLSHHHQQGLPGDRSKRSSAVDPDKAQAIPPRGDSRLAPQDDGYFASAKAAEVEDGCLDTHVKLSAVNGSIQNRDEGGPSMPREDTVLQHDTVYMEPAKMSPGDMLESDADGSLRIPNQLNRISSPPALQKDQTHAHTLSPSNRLQQRHTLEVPRVSTTRLSRESPNRADLAEVISASGRVTPSTPTRRRGSMTLVRRATRSLHSDMHLEDVPQDEDAARWTEVMRQKRMSKRKRKEEEEEEDGRVVMGTKVDQNHVNYVTAYNMLTGIRFTVSRTNAKLDRELTDADFEARHKFSFDVTGNELTPSAKYDFKFKDYAPWVFRHLRAIFRLDPADYLMSLTSQYILSELGSPGKSGSFFYYSRDYKYIIKTIHHSEHKFLRKILKDYFNHVQQNPNTLLSQFYGLHRVKIPYGRKIHFVVMNNLFPPHKDIHRKFDLKGSTIGREFKEEDLEKNPHATLKDLNWLRRNLHLEFGPTKKHMFIQQMQNDVAFLRRLQIMDYSLLVGIHDLERGNEDKLRDKTLQVFQPGGEKAEDPHQPMALTRTPSKLETARQAKELRRTLRTEKPVPMGQTVEKMPDEMGNERKGFYFYQDDGGFRASHEDNSPGEEIYYLGIIDCLTHYGFVKRLEHFYKGISSPESQISAVPPDRYGDRFVRFITGITKTREAAEKELAENRARKTHSIEDPRLSGGLQHRNKTEEVMEKAERQAERSVKHGANESNVPDQRLTTERSPSADRTEPGGFTLPVVEEAAENQSTGGRSGRSRDASVSPHLRPGDPDLEQAGLKPPPTPPKDHDGMRPPTPDKRSSHGGHKPPTPPRYSRGDVHLDKQLPPPPPMSPTRDTLQDAS